MDKKFFSPAELMAIASRHAYCAEYLLRNNAEAVNMRDEAIDTLFPVVSLLYLAFELTLKAFLLKDHQKNGQHKTLLELLELNKNLGLSNQEQQLLQKLSRQYAFRKGADHEFWDDRQQLQIFCIELIKLYERLQKLMPLELQDDYQV